MNQIGIISMFYARPFGREHFSTFARAKKSGCDFVELLVPEPGELDPKETKAALADHGLGCVLAARVNLTCDLASSDPAAHREGVRYLESCVEIANGLGAAIVGGPLYGAPLVFAGRPPAPVSEDERKRGIDAVVLGLMAAGRVAQAGGVLFAVEPLNRFETDIACTTRQGLAIVEEVGSPAVGLMLDTFHMNMEEFDLADAIRRAGKHMVHFQANENNRGFVGAGHIDWPAIARALRDVKYQGPITLEPFRRDDERPGVPYAQWKPPARDEDGELAASIAFLRGALEFARRTA